MFFEPGFLSPSFIILLAGIAGLRAFVPDRLLLRYGVLAAILLLAFSKSWPTAAPGTGLALLVIFPIAQGIARAKVSSNAARARFLLGIGVVVILTLWVFVKVTREIKPQALQDTRVSDFLLATIGFSYFIFRPINFLWMLYPQRDRHAHRRCGTFRPVAAPPVPRSRRPRERTELLLSLTRATAKVPRVCDSKRLRKPRVASSSPRSI